MAVVFGLKEIRVIELDAALARGPEDGSVVLRGDEPPNLPVRDGRGEAVAKGARQGRDAAKLADNPVHGLHDPRFYTLGVNRQHGMCKASSLHVLWMKPAEELRKLIERSGLSQEKVAQACEYSFASGLQRYISDDYAKPFLPRELVEKLKKPLVGKGTPPITEDEIYALAGLVQRTAEIPGAPMVEVAALSVEGAMGGGAVVEAEEEIGRFGFPAGEFSVSPERLRIITVTGDSMFNPSDPSSLQSGDRVLVDIGQRVPAQGGIYALFNGMGTVVKRVEMLPKQKKLRVFSINPAYSDDVFSPREVHIHGRVIGVWRRM